MQAQRPPGRTQNALKRLIEASSKGEEETAGRLEAKYLLSKHLLTCDWCATQNGYKNQPNVRKKGLKINS